MVFPNFFITFVRHSFHTSHPYTSPSRERRHRLHHTCHQAPHSPHGTRSLTRHAHALHIAKGHAHATLSRAAPRKGLCHTRCSPSQPPPPHYNPRKGLCHTRCSPSQHTRPPHYPPQRAMPRTRLMRKMPQCLPLQPPFSKKKERASTTKILHITILHVTFTRIGVKTTQKSEAIFSFID